MVETVTIGGKAYEVQLIQLQCENWRASAKVGNAIFSREGRGHTGALRTWIAAVEQMA
jgi:hypothetical protein